MNKRVRIFAVVTAALGALALLVEKQRLPERPLNAEQISRASGPSPSGQPVQAARTAGPATPARLAATGTVPDLVPAPNPAPVTASRLGQNARLTSELHNRGSGTARDAVETLLWAAVNRQTDAGAELVTWRRVSQGEPTRKELDSLFAGAPDEWQRHARSPERLITMMRETEMELIGAVEILGTRVFNGDSEEVIVRLTSADGATRDVQFLMVRTATGWRRQEWPRVLESVIQNLKSARR